MPPERPNREAERFDAFRRDLIRKCIPVQKEARAEWEKRFNDFVETALPEPKKVFTKPGLAARMFAAEVEVHNANPRDLEVYSQQLELVWEAKVPKEQVEWRTLLTPDRHDMLWEFAADLGGAYVTGLVKLRSYTLDKPENRERRPYQKRDDGDRPRRPYQRRDDRPSGGDDRPKRPYQRRDDRPSGGDDRPKRPYQRRDDRPGGRPYGGRDSGGPKRSYGPRKPRKD